MVEALSYAVTKSPYRLLPKEITNHMNVNKTYKRARKYTSFFIPVALASFAAGLYALAKGNNYAAGNGFFAGASTYAIGKDAIKSFELYQPAYREIVDRASNIKKLRADA